MPAPLTVLFDLDGTLTDSRPGITACLRHALDRVGHPCPDDRALAVYVGPPLRGTLSALLGTTDPARIEAAIGHYRARYDTVGLFDNRVYDEVPIMLEAVAQRGHAMLVATAKMRHTAARIVEHFGLTRHFTGVYGAEPGGRFDAKIDLLAHLVESGVVSRERSIMVGDRASDIVAAKINGIRSIGALWGYAEPGELAAAGADLLCESPRALPHCLGDGRR